MSWQRLQRVFHLDRFGRRREESLDEEVRFHLETRVERFVRAGMPPDKARAEALRRFGDPDVVAERCRRIDQKGRRRRALAELLHDASQDVQSALRGLIRTRGFTFVAVLSLAVGIGVNTAVFTGIHAVWLAPVPGTTGPDRVTDVVTVDGGHDRFWWAYPDYATVRDAETPIEALAAWAERDATLGAGDGGQRVRVAYTTANYFRVLGALPTLGRSFLDSEDAGVGQHPVAVVSHDLWQDRLGGDPDIIGRSITVNRAPYTVVGVAPEEFRGARPTLWSTGLWVPLTQHPYLAGERDYLRDRSAFWVQVLGRLRPGATLAAANTAVQTVFGRMAEEFPETNQDRSARANSFGRFPAQNRIWDMLAVGMLAGLLVLVLMIICGNLAGMVLARSASREQELAVRLALGSSRTRLVRHLMVEALLLAIAGGGIGTLVAVVGMGTISPATLGIVAPGVDFEINGAIIAASLALTFAAALAFGLLPAIRFSRPELVSSLKDSAGVGGRRVGRIQRFAASAQTGLALLSLVIGSLFLRSLTIMTEGDLGFEPDGMAIADFQTGAMSSALLDLSEEGYPTLEDGAGALLERLSEAIGALPGVASVAFADGVPLDRRGAFASASRVDQFDDEGGRVTVEFTRATEGYFAAIGTPIVQGRGFESTDDAASQPVAVITESLAELLWPGEAALGRQFSWPVTREERRAVTVIGVVGNVASSRATEDRPHVFIPLRQEYYPRLMMVVRAGTEASALAESIRSAMRAVDPGLPMPRLITAESVVARSTQGQRGLG